MRKAIGVLAILVIVLLSGRAEEARAAEPNDDTYFVPREFTLSYSNGVAIPRGGLVEVKTNELLTLNVNWTGDYTPVATSGDLSNVTMTVAIPEADQNPTIDSVTVHIFYTPDTLTTGRLDITPQGPVDGVLDIQIDSILTDLNGTRTFPSVPFPIQLKTSPLVTDFRYLFVPKSMTLRNGSGQKVSSIYMEATQTVELYAETDDYLSDGYADNDYTMYPVATSTFNMAPVVQVEDESNLLGTSTTPTLVGLTPTLPTMEIPPRTIARVRVTARNPGGDQSSNYQPVYTDFTYQITFEGTTTGGVSLSNFLPNGGVIQTPPVSVVILAKDDATGTFDDAGGSCAVLGLGALALLVPVTLIRRRK